MEKIFNSSWESDIPEPDKIKNYQDVESIIGKLKTAVEVLSTNDEEKKIKHFN